MLEYKREIDEVIAIYNLEQELFDVYVEGPTDKFIIENYLSYKNNFKDIIEIDHISFNSIQGKYSDLDLRSNKDKLIALSRVLLENKTSSEIKCIVDKDFDEIFGKIEENDHLVYTEYCCLESYFFCDEHIEPILSFAIKNFPVKTEFVIQQIASAVSGVFKIRMLNNFFQLNLSIPQIDRNIPMDRKTGILNFNFENYLDIFINSNKLSGRKKEFQDFLAKIDNQIGKDVRFQMNGHDFVQILFYYINKTKNTVNFRLENFERTFYISFKPHHLDKYAMFHKLCG